MLYTHFPPPRPAQSSSPDPVSSRPNDVYLVNHRSYMKHIKDLMIKAAIAKIRAYEAELRAEAATGNDKEVDKLQRMIKEWRKILENLLAD